MTKGQITLLITGGIALAGLFFQGDIRFLLLTTGVTGIIGCATNALAIRMLFDRIYLIPRNKKWPLPFSGILELKREELALAIGHTVSQHLVSPEAIMKTVTSEKFREITHATVKEKLWQISQDKEILDTLVEEIEKALSRFIDSDVFRTKLQQTLLRHLGPVGLLVEVGNFRAKEKVTSVLQNEIKQLVKYVCTDYKFQHALQTLLQNLPEKFFASQSPLKENIQQYCGAILKELVEKIDIEKVVAEEVSSFAPGQLSNIIIKITGKNLDWLEVWGGFLGALGGAVFWGISQYL